ncbi:hypothetical protein SAMN02799631_02138 [Methylobacterium sp. 174MFSha1.1]|nr:hypothetical protein SAMN02799631_02138 [Methylobacterium sp. 174MFSha1.1]
MNPALDRCIAALASAFVATHGAHPRMATVFATQQRWLMAHVALAQSCEALTDPAAPDLYSSRFLKAVVSASVASRNTAHAFLQEMLKYSFLQAEPDRADRRLRRLTVSETSLAGLANWILIHLTALDSLSEGDRVRRFRAVPDGVARLEPGIARRLLEARKIRDPDRTFSLFTWLNQGGLVMDLMMAGLEEAPADPDRIVTGIVSAQDLAADLNVSRTNLSRKLREAEEAGSLGWSGRRGNSALWISSAFRREYVAYQAAKLALIDAAFDEGMPAPQDGSEFRSDFGMKRRGVC